MKLIVYSIILSFKAFVRRGMFQRGLIAVLIGVGLALAIQYQLDGQCVGAICRGDLPAFYAAGKIILAGDGSNLYSSITQQEIQARFWPSLGDSFLYFAYPPQTASIVAGLALMPPIAAKLLLIALSISALAVVVSKLSVFSEWKVAWNGEWFLILLLFAPLLHGIISGQNAAFSLMLFCLFATLFSSSTTKSSKKSLFAGLILGLWCFKPHLVVWILFFVLIFWRGQMSEKLKLLLGVFISLLLSWIVAALFVGSGSYNEWVRALAFFGPKDLEVNGFQSISPLKIFGDLLKVGETITISKIILVLIYCTPFGMAANLWLKYSNINQLRSKLVLLLGPLTVLMSPHMLYYDVTLGLLPLLVLVNLKDSRTQLGVCLILCLGLIAVATRYLMPQYLLLFLVYVSFCFVTYKINSIVKCGEHVASPSL